MGILDHTNSSHIVVDALNSELRRRLTKHFEEQAKPVIQQVVEACVNDFNVDATLFEDLEFMRTTVRFVLSDRTNDKNGKQAAE